MEEKKINLEEIIEDELYNRHLYFNKINNIQIKNICLEFGRQLLELAAENAILTLNEDEDYSFLESFPKNLGFEYEGIYNLVTINEQSILDTIKQVE